VKEVVLPKTLREMITMTEKKSCQVCAKPITDREMCFEKTYKGRKYFACCPICFSMLQEEPENHIGTWLAGIM
jgi:YHS domain-containing protein